MCIIRHKFGNLRRFGYRFQNQTNRTGFGMNCISSQDLVVTSKALRLFRVRLNISVAFNLVE
jgi:hypothetical protein